ncbi:neutral protease 2 [Aspergillus arachidicola]|uniref:Neutral protease 2 n=1 Tax=Aspergillus arachidicola TaxID=656916 RepID=A0A5N6XNC9_9EURO|nr:neutral protease 2 [Aspergillus arachidicola]
MRLFSPAFFVLPFTIECAVSSRLSPILDVTLSRMGNTRIKAVVKNTGRQDISFVHLNFFGNSAPVKKVSIFRENEEIEFEGVIVRFRTDGLTNESVTSLPAGGTLEDEFDLASTSDLTAGGPILIHSEGTVPVVTNGNVTGYVAYQSNTLQLEVNGLEAERVSRTLPSNHQRRDFRCSSQTKDILARAISTASRLANKAAETIESGDDLRFKEFFKATDRQQRMIVSDRFRAVAKEASGGGLVTYHCSDPYGICGPDSVAYARGYLNEIITCDRFYSQYPLLTRECDSVDQATTVLHELTHVPAVYNPATRDLAYGYDAATQLSAREARDNADNYAFYSLVVELQC